MSPVPSRIYIFLLNDLDDLTNWRVQFSIIRGCALTLLSLTRNWSYPKISFSSPGSKLLLILQDLLQDTLPTPSHSAKTHLSHCSVIICPCRPVDQTGISFRSDTMSYKSQGSHHIKQFQAQRGSINGYGLLFLTILCSAIFPVNLRLEE